MKRHGFFRKTLAFAFLAVLICGSKLAYAESKYDTGWSSADYVQARLVSTTTAMGNMAEITGALEIRLSDGWHAYWRMPGAGGLPPRFHWQDSENLAAVELSWPLPKRFKTLDLYSFGYEDHVFLPFTAIAENAGMAMKIRLDADIMVCSDICVPQNVKMAINIPAGAPQSSISGARIQRVMADLPHRENRPNLKIDNVVIGPDALVITTFAQRGYDDVDVFVESGDLYVTAPPVIKMDDDDPRKAVIRIAAPDDVDNLYSEIGDRKITLTFTDGRTAIERVFDFTDDGAPDTTQEESPPAAGSTE